MPVSLKKSQLWNIIMKEGLQEESSFCCDADAALGS